MKNLIKIFLLLVISILTSCKTREKEVSKNETKSETFSKSEIKIERKTIDFVFNSLNARKLKLEVFEDNIQVINLHRKYNFKKSGEKFVDNKKVICMELNNIDLIIKVKND